MHEEREVLYPKPKIMLCVGEKALTVTRTKKLMGWEEETEENKFGAEYLLKNKAGVKIRCTNNVTNRPLNMGNVWNLVQEILRGRWYLNMENRIIGETGLVLNGQHTFIALILAAEEWELSPELYPFWTEEPTMETSIGFGCSESDAVVNTMDTCKPRTLADVIYRSEFFQDTKTKDRVKLAKVTDHAVRLLWDRTGVPNAYAIRRTHSESLDFIARHPKILACVNHVYEENDEGNSLGNVLPVGYCAGLLYLFGSSETDATDYAMSKEPTEKHLKWDNWDRACDFFVLLAGGSKQLKPLRTKMVSLQNSDNGVSLKEKIALVVKAWLAFSSSGKVTIKDLRLDYDTDEEGWKTLADRTTAGGIDQGNVSTSDFLDAIKEEQRQRQQTAKDKAVEAAEEKAAPSPEEIKERAKDVRNGSSSQEKPPAKKSRRKRPSARLTGKLMWVADKEPWRGKVLEVEGEKAKLKVSQGFQGAGNIQVVLVSALSKTQPK